MPLASKAGMTRVIDSSFNGLSLNTKVESLPSIVLFNNGVMSTILLSSKPNVRRLEVPVSVLTSLILFEPNPKSRKFGNFSNTEMSIRRLLLIDKTVIDGQLDRKSILTILLLSNSSTCRLTKFFR